MKFIAAFVYAVFPPTSNPSFVLSFFPLSLSKKPNNSSRILSLEKLIFLPSFERTVFLPSVREKEKDVYIYIYI